MKYQLIKHIKAIFIITIFCAQSVSAGTLATYESPEGGITYEIEGDNVRMNISGAEHGMYQLLLGDKAYNVMTDDNGEVRVTDVGEMMGMVSGFSKMVGVKIEQLEFADTGEKETIAGYKGSVYTSKMRIKTGFSKKTTTSEMVLSNHPDVYKVSSVMQRMAKIIGGSGVTGSDDMLKALENQKLGVLRSDEMRLVSIESQNIATSRFELPAEPTSMGNMAQDASKKSSGFLGSVFGNKTERQKNRQKSRANSATDRAADTAVDKTVNKVLDKLFSF